MQSVWRADQFVYPIFIVPLILMLSVLVKCDTKGIAAQYQQLAKVPVVSVHNLTRNFQKMSLKKQQDSPSLSILLPQIWFVCLCVPEPTGITDERKRVSFAVGLCVTNELVISSASPKQSTFTFYTEKTQTHTSRTSNCNYTVDTTQQWKPTSSTRKQESLWNILTFSL